MRTILSILIFVLGLISNAQTTISGIVATTKDEPIEGANIYLEGTYDGATTNETGAFSFKTSEVGSQTLIVSYLSYETYYMV